MTYQQELLNIKNLFQQYSSIDYNSEFLVESLLFPEIVEQKKKSLNEQILKSIGNFFKKVWGKIKSFFTASKEKISNVMKSQSANVQNVRTVQGALSSAASGAGGGGEEGPSFEESKELKIINILISQPEKFESSYLQAALKILPSISPNQEVTKDLSGYIKGEEMPDMDLDDIGLNKSNDEINEILKSLNEKVTIATKIYESLPEEISKKTESPELESKEEKMAKLKSVIENNPELVNDEKYKDSILTLMNDLSKGSVRVIIITRAFEKISEALNSYLEKMKKYTEDMEKLLNSDSSQSPEPPPGSNP